MVTTSVVFMQHRLSLPSDVGVPLNALRKVLYKIMTAPIFCQTWIEKKIVVSHVTVTKQVATCHQADKASGQLTTISLVIALSVEQKEEGHLQTGLSVLGFRELSVLEV